MPTTQAVITGHPPQGQARRWISRAPGRVNIIGEHVDYNDGWVLPMAIEREILIRATAREDRRAHFSSRQAGESLEIDLDRPDIAHAPTWGKYLLGVLLEFQRATCVALPGFDGVIDSTVPLGGGLSSSAALCVATATLLEKISGQRLTPLDKALLCQKVEHDYAGVPCGLMDQMASVMCRSGHLLLLDCRSNEVRHVPFGDTGIAVVVIHSGVSHNLADGAYAIRREQCAAVLRRSGLSSYRDMSEGVLERLRPQLDDALYRRARHVILENKRTLGVADSIVRGDMDSLGAHLYASHESLARDFEVSCPELDFLVEAARALGPENGVIGARMTGGGFGGCTVTLVQKAFAERVAGTIQRRFRDAFGHEPVCFVTQAAEGAE
jgi:galactokinase